MFWKSSNLLKIGFYNEPPCSNDTTSKVTAQFLFICTLLTSATAISTTAATIIIICIILKPISDIVLFYLSILHYIVLKGKNFLWKTSGLYWRCCCPKDKLTPGILVSVPPRWHFPKKFLERSTDTNMSFGLRQGFSSFLFSRHLYTLKLVEDLIELWLL